MDISKAFDRVWHDGLIYKIKCIEVNGMFLKLVTSFMKNRVVLNGRTSSWEPVLAGVPQGSVLWLLFYLIYINDLSKNLSSNTKLFADDACIFSTVKNVNVSTDQLISDLQKISNLAHQ